MTFDEYQKLAIRTINPKLSVKERFDMLALGLRGESGEIAEAVKKGRYHSHPLDERRLSLEIGDVAWYIACLAETFGTTLSTFLTALRTHEVHSWGWLPENSNDVKHFQLCAENLLVPVEERDEKLEQLSEFTHGLCEDCGALASSAMFWRANRKVPVNSDETNSLCIEIGCVLLTCAHYAIVLERSLETILEENVAKLKARYPEGFTAEASLKRVDVR